MFVLEEGEENGERCGAFKIQPHSSLWKCRLKIEKHPSAYQELSNEHQATSSASTKSALSFISEQEACLLMFALIRHVQTLTHKLVLVDMLTPALKLRLAYVNTITSTPLS